MQHPPPTGDPTVALLFTDIEDSTGHWRRSPDAMRDALQTHDTLLARAVERAGGTVFKTIGDAFCAVFPNAGAALDAACDLQRAVVSTFAGGALSIRVRAAIHVGVVQCRDDDYFGLELSRVARALGCAHGGQIVVTDATAALLRDNLPEGVRLSSLGPCRLRGFDTPENLFQIVAEGLPDIFPPPRELASIRHNLPRAPAELIGRGVELGEIKRLLALRPLVTLDGPGGSGKTRLAIHAAERLVESFPGGLFFVDLTPASDRASVIAATLAACELPVSPDAPERAIAESFGGGDSLIVLDNCEHVIDFASAWAESLLSACPNLRILATSREALGIESEARFPVPPLSLPDLSRPLTVRRLLQSDAARLFCERANAISPKFSVRADNLDAIASICHRLDGIPLALLIAASWTAALTPAQISQRLVDRFKLLQAGGMRTALPRQQTVRAAIDWSYNLLSESERALLKRVSHFADGFTLDAAEAVCAGEPVADVLSDLFSLVKKSLVQTIAGSDGLERFRLLETIREYGAEKREADGPGVESALRERHRTYFLALCERIAPRLHEADPRPFTAELQAERENLRCALETCRDEAPADGPRFVAALFWHWYTSGQSPYGFALAQSLLARDPSPETVDPSRAKAFNGAGILAWMSGELPDARAWFERGLALENALGNPGKAAGCLSNLGSVAALMGDMDGSLAYLERAAHAYRALGDTTRLALVLSNLAANFIDRKDYDRAVPLLEETLLLHRRQNNSSAVANTLHNQALIASYGRNYDHAVSLLSEAIESRLSSGLEFGVAGDLEELGIMLHQKHRTSEARQAIVLSNLLRQHTQETRSSNQSMPEPELLLQTDDGTRLTEEIGQDFARVLPAISQFLLLLEQPS